MDMVGSILFAYSASCNLIVIGVGDENMWILIILIEHKKAHQLRKMVCTSVMSEQSWIPIIKFAREDENPKEDVRKSINCFLFF